MKILILIYVHFTKFIIDYYRKWILEFFQYISHDLTCANVPKLGI